ncbi:MAG: aldo/keto reductase [Verrucomicrobiota bacterium JB022]|nr:aldo/keto reductase [Verrucomicrobiota bacterium JB022]
MDFTDLGNAPLRVSRLGLGCMGMSEFYGEYATAAAEKESIAVIQRAVDLGVTFFDTADMYGRGENEKLLGKALHDGRRERVVVATKFGITRGDSPWIRGVNGRPEYVKQACEASLQRLGLDHIDLYYQHRKDPEVPIEDTIGAMKELVQEGKVIAVGLSEASPETLRRAHAVHPLAALQTEYSLWSRDPERELIPTCRELGITFVAYSPLGRGFLTGAFAKPEDIPEGDYRRLHPRFQGENFYQNLELVKQVEHLAEQKGVAASQLALAWLLAQGQDIVPIPGTKRLKYLEQNIAALDVTITDEEVARLNAILPLDATAGTRYPETSMKELNR